MPDYIATCAAYGFRKRFWHQGELAKDVSKEEMKKIPKGVFKPVENGPTTKNTPAKPAGNDEE